jgi:hypothetical protein
LLTGFPQKLEVPRSVEGKAQDISLKGPEHFCSIAVELQEGYSGGPCYWECGDRCFLLGINIKRDDGNASFSMILPGCCILERLAKIVPSSGRLKDVIALISQNELEFRTKGLVAFQARIAIRGMNAIEQYQLRDWICQNKTLTAITTEFLYDSFRNGLDSHVFMDVLRRCRPDVLVLMSGDARRLSAQAQSGLPVTDEKAAMGLEEVARALCTVSSEDLSAGERSSYSSLLTDVAMVRRSRLRDQTPSEESFRQLAAAYEFDRTNPDIGVALALTAPSLSERERLALTRDMIATVDHDATTEILTSAGNRLVFDELWSPLGTRCGNAGSDRKISTLFMNDVRATTPQLRVIFFAGHDLQSAAAHMDTPH